MRWISLRSSQVAAVAYDPGDSTLYVQFNSKGKSPESVYRYEGVSADVALGLLLADSHGSYLASMVKGHFPYSRIEHPELLGIHV